MNNENLNAKIERYNKRDIDTAAASKLMAARGGPTMPFQVDLESATATFGNFWIQFSQTSDGFAVDAFNWLGRGDNVETEDDCDLIDEACACFAKKLEKERAS